MNYTCKYSKETALVRRIVMEICRVIKIIKIINFYVLAKKKQLKSVKYLQQTRICTYHTGFSNGNGWPKMRSCDVHRWTQIHKNSFYLSILFLFLICVVCENAVNRNDKASLKAKWVFFNETFVNILHFFSFLNNVFTHILWTIYSVNFTHHTFENIVTSFPRSKVYLRIFFLNTVFIPFFIHPKSNS